MKKNIFLWLLVFVLFWVSTGVGTASAGFQNPAANGAQAGEGSPERVNELRLLFFGNSYTFSTLTYLPPLLDEALPDTNVTVGIAYRGGCSLSMHTDMFYQSTPYPLYAEYTTSSEQWTCFNDVYSAQMLLSKCRWNIIGLQQSVEQLRDFSHLEQLADMIAATVTYPVTFVYNLAQARHPNDNVWLPQNYPQEDSMMGRSNAHFADIADFARRAKNGAYIYEVLPTGTAVQNLRTLPMAESIGEAGYFSIDSEGHLQNGLGMLAAGYAACCKLLEIIGRAPSIYGLQFTPTDEYHIAAYTPFSKGSCDGVSPENKLVAIKCAMLACKNPFEISDCSGMTVAQAPAASFTGFGSLPVVCFREAVARADQVEAAFSHDLSEDSIIIYTLCNKNAADYVNNQVILAAGTNQTAAFNVGRVLRNNSIGYQWMTFDDWNHAVILPGDSYFPKRYSIGDFSAAPSGAAQTVKVNKNCFTGNECLNALFPAIEPGAVMMAKLVNKNPRSFPENQLVMLFCCGTKDSVEKTCFLYRCKNGSFTAADCTERYDAIIEAGDEFEFISYSS